MKCYACGYEKRYKLITTTEVVRFKSGKRKGEIKEVKEHSFDLYQDDPEFIEIVIAEEKVSIDKKRAGWKNYEIVGLYACPKCGTVRIGESDLYG